MKTKTNVEELETIEISNVNLPTFNNVDWNKIEKATNVRSLNFTYLKLEQGEIKRFIVAGIFNQLVNDRDTQLVGLYHKDEAFITASHMIVQACSKVQTGSIVEIIYKGDKNLTGGKKLGNYEVNEVIL